MLSSHVTLGKLLKCQGKTPSACSGQAAAIGPGALLSCRNACPVLLNLPFLKRELRNLHLDMKDPGFETLAAISSILQAQKKNPNPRTQCMNHPQATRWPPCLNFHI